MAKVTLVDDVGRSKLFLFIHHSVGRRGRNLRDDVLLIQMMLNEIGRPGAGLMQNGSFGKTAPVELFVDGMCGPKTVAAILAFQQAMNRERKCKFCVEDGTVNSTREAMWVESFKFTALDQLNSQFNLSLRYRGIAAKFWFEREASVGIIKNLLAPVNVFKTLGAV